MRSRAARSHIREVAENLVPDALNLRRIITGQQVGHMPNHRRNSTVCTLTRARHLSPSSHACIRVNLHKQILAVSPLAASILRRGKERTRRGYQPWTDLRDLHAVCFLRA